MLRMAIRQKRHELTPPRLQQGDGCRCESICRQCRCRSRSEPAPLEDEVHVENNRKLPRQERDERTGKKRIGANPSGTSRLVSKRFQLRWDI